MKAQNTHWQYCQDQLAKKLGFDVKTRWTQRELEYLIKHVYKETGILISISTLKRLSKGQIRRPHASTLDALAQFIGYQDWPDFSKSCNSFESSNISIQVNHNLYRILKYTIAGVALIIIIGIIYRCYLNDDYSSVTFTSETTVSSGVPNTVIFNYDVSKIRSNDIEIQQSWDPSKRKALDKTKQYYTSVYYYPGVHRAKLVINGEVVRQHILHIKSDGWLPIIQTSYNQEIPFYLSLNKVQQNGELYISPEMIQSANLDLINENIFIRFIRIQTFNSTDGDNFSLETKIKNDINEGGQTGQYFNLTVFCKNRRSVIPLTIPGCVGNINLKLSELYLSGQDNDFSNFGHDMTNWQILRMEVKEKSVQLKINEKTIYQTTYQMPIGELMGFSLEFMGCGKVDYINIWNEEDKLVFSDNFDK